MLKYLFWSAITISILQICGVTQSADFPNATEILDPDIELTSHQKHDATKRFENESMATGKVCLT